MADKAENSKKQFLNPIGKFQGEFTPQNLAFNANLQEFANFVALICGLETNGKISSKEAYDKIKEQWKILKVSKKQLIDKYSDQ